MNDERVSVVSGTLGAGWGVERGGGRMDDKNRQLEQSVLAGLVTRGY